MTWHDQNCEEHDDCDDEREGCNSKAKLSYLKNNKSCDKNIQNENINNKFAKVDGNHMIAPGTSVKEYIKSMNEDAICAWLEYVFGKQFCEKTGVQAIFRNNYINGQVLLTFDKKMLKDLNVGNSIQQQRFYLEIENFRNMKSLDEKLVSYVEDKKNTAIPTTHFNNNKICWFALCIICVIVSIVICSKDW